MNLREDVKNIKSSRGSYAIETADSVYLLGKTNKVICLDEEGKDKILKMLNDHNGSLDDLIDELNLLKRSTSAKAFMSHMLK